MLRLWLVVMWVTLILSRSRVVSSRSQHVGSLHVFPMTTYPLSRSFSDMTPSDPFREDNEPLSVRMKKLSLDKMRQSWVTFRNWPKRFGRTRSSSAASSSPLSGSSHSNAHATHLGSATAGPRTRLRTKVITDIDDTVVASGGHKLFGIRLGGVDNRYRRGQLYPGVIQFALEMSRGHHQTDDESSRNAMDSVAVLTARAREFKFALALRPTGKLCSAYRSVASNNGLTHWGIGDVYYGSVAEWILHHRKGWRKFKNFELMMEKDDAEHRNALGRHRPLQSPEASHHHAAHSSHEPVSSHGRQYILIGDTGEKDEEAGERMAENYPTRVRAVFLHAVQSLRASRRMRVADLPPVVVPQDRFVNGVPLIYFRTYVGAATRALEENLISREGVLRVARTAVKEMHAIDKVLQSPTPTPTTLLQQKMSRWPLWKRLFKTRQQQAVDIQSLRWRELRSDIEAVDFIRDDLIGKLPVDRLGQ